MFIVWIAANVTDVKRLKYLWYAIESLISINTDNIVISIYNTYKIFSFKSYKNLIFRERSHYMSTYEHYKTLYTESISDITYGTDTYILFLHGEDIILSSLKSYINKFPQFVAKQYITISKRTSCTVCDESLEDMANNVNYYDSDAYIEVNKDDISIDIGLSGSVISYSNVKTYFDFKYNINMLKYFKYINIKKSKIPVIISRIQNALNNIQFKNLIKKLEEDTEVIKQKTKVLTEKKEKLDQKILELTMNKLF